MIRGLPFGNKTDLALFHNFCLKLDDGWVFGSLEKPGANPKKKPFGENLVKLIG